MDKDYLILKRASVSRCASLSAKRRFCNTVGKRFIDGARRCCAVSTARSRAAAMTNLARASLALVLRFIFGALKSCALVNLFMVCPPKWSAGGLADQDEILPLITAISWRTYETLAH